MPSSDGINIPGLIDTRPNPLRVLGLGTEAVKGLDDDTLLIAARGLYRAWSSRLHPDKTGRKAASQRFLGLKEAFERLEAEGVAVHREQYLREQVKLARKKSTSQAAEDIHKEKELLLKAQARTRELNQRFVDAVTDPEAVFNLEAATVLVRNYSNFVVKAQGPDFQQLELSGGQVSTTNIRFEGTFEPPQTLKRQHTAGISSVYSDGVEPVWLRGPDSIWLPLEGKILAPGWYTIRGQVAPDGEDLRSLQAYVAAGEPQTQTYQLIGSIPLEDLKSLVNRRYRHMTDRPRSQLESGRAMSPGARSSDAAQVYYSSQLQKHEWETVLTDISPYIIEGEALVVRVPDSGSKITSEFAVLGKIEAAKLTPAGSEQSV
ncbi:hypothetical protein HY346_02555 [Candidatus Microgenomates bacterium]|nr:hypothetical protein [Candidatus Microgenomates bacterium]